MTAFQDMLQADLNGIFFNTMEFAEVHSIETGGNAAVNMTIIIDNDIIKEILGAFDDPQGIYDSERLFLVRASEFGELPAGEQKLILDGEKYLVKLADPCSEDLYLIGLGRYGS